VHQLAGSFCDVIVWQVSPFAMLSSSGLPGSRRPDDNACGYLMSVSADTVQIKNHDGPPSTSISAKKVE